MSLEIARILLEIRAVQFKPDSPITFKSGIKSPVYIDNRCLPFHPSHWKIVIEHFQRLIVEHDIPLDVLAGIEAAGIPHSAALSFAMQKPSVFVRKEAKAHGQGRRIEGGEVSGLRVLLVEDMVTTGGSSLSGVAALREAGALVSDCLAITSYDFPEAAQNFAKAEVNLHTLATFTEIWEVAKVTLTPAEVEIVETWRRAPHEWGKTL